MSQMTQAKQTTSIMRKNRFAVSVLMLALSLWTSPKAVQAQWVDIDTNLYTTTDNVGIGTTNPTIGYKLDVVQPQTEFGQHGLRVLAGTTITDNVVYFTGNPSLGYDFVMKQNGYIGIGTMDPANTLHLNTSGGPVIRLTRTGFPSAFKIDTDGSSGAIATDTAHPLLFRTNNVERLRIDSNGNIGIGTTAPSTKLHVVGDITVTGNIAAKYQDVAEWVTSPKSMLAGTVVVLDTAHTNRVLPSVQAYDTRVAEVVSDMPGILLGEAGEGKVKVATTGRVKVKVDATKKSIQVGDLLVTSDKEGVAMESEPLDLGGVPIHRPGTLIGKALEPLSEGEGEILVLLSLQ